MNKLIIMIITLLLAIYLKYNQDHQQQPDIEYQWNHFIAKYSKIYPDQISHQAHKQTFINNYNFILQHNQLYFNNQSSFLLDINQYTDLTNHQFRSQHGTFNYHDIDWQQYQYHIPNYNSYPIIDHHDLNQPIDWRSKGGVIPVRNQGSCGSCWAFSATAALSTLKYTSQKVLIDLSVQNLIDCSTKNGNNGCDGGTMNEAFNYVIDNGLEAESTYPYQAKKYTCRQTRQNNKISIKNYNTVQSNNSTALKQALNYNTVSVGIDGNGLYMQFYRKGIFDKCGTSLDHAVLLVGYAKDPNQQQYYIVQNSWGTDWGEDGYVRIRDNDPNGKGVCGIQMYSSYPVI